MALRGTLTHRKTRRLSRVLGVPPCYALGVVEALWHVTAEQCPDGAIGVLSNQDIADEMFFDGDADFLINALIESGFLDAAERFRLVVHDWNVYSDQSVKRKVARHGKGFARRDGTWLVMASSPEPEPEPEPVSSNQSQKSQKNTSQQATPTRVANPTLDECKAYALERFNLNGEFASRFFEVNEERGWKDKSGKPYQNWKNLMRVWFDREDHPERYRPKPKPDNSMVHR